MLGASERRSEQGVPYVFCATRRNGRSVFTAALTVAVFRASENTFLRSFTIALLNDNVSLEMITHLADARGSAYPFLPTRRAAECISNDR